MASQLFYAQSGVIDLADVARTRLAGAKVRLWKAGLNLSFATTRAELLAVECDYTGYAAGGITVPGWSSPSLGPEQAAMINPGTVNFVCGTAMPQVGNVVGGWWLETAGGVLWIACQWPEPVAMQEPDQGQPVSLTLFFPSG